ncbi:MAG: hypothetical protein WC719_03625 [Patescibacteria group bacterium]
MLAINPKMVQAYHSTSSYDKLYNDTLTSDNWNDLFADFVNTWLPVSLNGPVGIATSAPAVGLEVNGLISGSSIFSSGNVGFGTAVPTARLEVVPASGYSVLAGNFKIGNVALPTVDSDAATKGYVDSFVASATSSISTLWGGLIGGNIWSLNSGNVGIGTTAPTSQLHIGLNNVGIGTVSVPAGGTVVTGVGTKFLNQTHQGGFTITIGAETRTITVAINDTSLNVSAAFTNAYTDSPFTISGTSKVVIDGNSYGRFSYSSILTEINSNNNGAYGLRTNSAVKGNGFYLYNSTGGFYTNTGVPMFYATATGRFGIGTTSPAGFLHVEGTGNIILNAGNVGIGTTSPLAKLEVVPASGYSILAGNYKIGNVAIPTVDSDAATKGYVDSFVVSYVASSTGVVSSALYVGITPTAYTGDNNGSAGYTTAQNACKAAYASSSVCTPDNILGSIAAGITLAAEDVWIFAGPPGYTAAANDCEGRSVATTAAYGTYWQIAMSGRPQGRGLLMTCNNSLRIACCR